jgi:hypothetical protein
MSLIAIFTDYVVNKKSLKEYVEVRKSIRERGVFNDATLLQAEEDLQRLKREDPQTYKAMYRVLDEIIRRDEGYHVEYPVNFIRQILRIYQGGVPAKKVLESYREALEHHSQSAL